MPKLETFFVATYHAGSSYLLEEHSSMGSALAEMYHKKKEFEKLQKAMPKIMPKEPPDMMILEKIR